MKLCDVGVKKIPADIEYLIMNDSFVLNRLTKANKQSRFRISHGCGILEPYL